MREIAVSHSMFGEGCAIVIGGSGGIGAGICLEFARSGTNVAICYNSKKAAADELQTQITALGVSASVHKVDARDPASLKALFSDAATLWTQVCLVCLGLTQHAPLGSR